MSTMASVRAVVASGIALLAACGGRSGAPIGPAEIIKDISTNSDLDILLVIANTPECEQIVLNANLATFVTGTGGSGGLANFGGVGLPSLHVGVIDTTVDIGVTGYGPRCPSPDPADNGLLQNTAQVTGCKPPTERFLSDIENADGTRTTNYGGAGAPADLATELQCIAEVGTSGCGFLAPLEAMKRALDGSNPANAGFLRADADLAIIILTDEDDMSGPIPGDLMSTFPVQASAYTCDTPISLTTPGTYTDCTASSHPLQDPAYYAGFLSTIKDPSQTVVAVISGTPPSFTTNDVPPQ
jgi:hypothetical protein